jgi:hypothetical protein
MNFESFAVIFVIFLAASRVNKFGAFSQNLPKFSGFGPARIQNAPNLVN